MSLKECHGNLHSKINISNFDGQENCLQHFKFAEPVLCIGGYLQIELLGIAERCDIDNLFYIWLVFETFLF